MTVLLLLLWSSPVSH